MPTDITAMTPGAYVTAALLKVGGQLLGAGVLGGNYAGAGEPRTYSGSQLFTFASGSFNSGELYLGLIGVDDGFDSGPANFVSMTVTVDATDGGPVSHRIWTFDDVSSLDAFLNDDALDLGFVIDPAMTFSLGFDLTADGAGGMDFGFAFATVSDVPEPGSLAMLLTACVPGGLVARRRRAGTPAGRGQAGRNHDV